MQVLSFNDRTLWNIVLLGIIFLLSNVVATHFQNLANDPQHFLKEQQIKIIQRRAASSNTVTLDCCDAAQGKLTPCKDVTILKCTHPSVASLNLPECSSETSTVSCCDKEIAAKVGSSCTTSAKGDCNSSEIVQICKDKGNGCTANPSNSSCDCFGKINEDLVQCCQLNPEHSVCCSSKSGEELVICCKSGSMEHVCEIPISTCNGSNSSECPDCTITVDRLICCTLNPLHNVCSSIERNRSEKHGLRLYQPCSVKDDKCLKENFLECKPVDDDEQLMEKGFCGCLEGLWSIDPKDPCKIPLDEPCGKHTLHGFRGLPDAYKEFTPNCQDLADCVTINDNPFCRASEDKDYPMFVSKKRANELGSMSMKTTSTGNIKRVTVTELAFYVTLFWIAQSLI